MDPLKGIEKMKDAMMRREEKKGIYFLKMSFRFRGRFASYNFNHDISTHDISLKCLL